MSGTGTGRESLCGAACGYDRAYHIRAMVSNTSIIL